jgi:hypothetical protein
MCHEMQRSPENPPPVLYLRIRRMSFFKMSDGSFLMYALLGVLAS